MCGTKFTYFHTNKFETHEKKKLTSRHFVDAKLMCLERIQVETDEDKSV
jgi:hypothetical protein